MKKTEKNKYLPYGRQHIDANDIQEVVSVLESDYLTTGKKTIDSAKLSTIFGLILAEKS